MSKTVTSLFKSEAQASSAVRRLEEAGISQGRICLFNGTGTGHRFWEGTSSFDQDSGSSGSSDRIVHYLHNNGVPSSDAHSFAEGVRRGNTLVAVRCDDSEADRVVSILDGDDALDFEEQEASWRSDGWAGGAGLTGSGMGSTGMGSTGMGSTGMGTSGMGTTGMGTTGMGSSGAGMAGVGSTNRTGSGTGGREDEVIQVAEEELHVGKREVSKGRVRIHSHVVERPVQEQVSLREEHVSVERRPVEGTRHTGSVGTDNLFRERTIEMDERSEEAVVAKEARVTEELVVRKDVNQRTETVSDTVRKTEVEVQDERGNRIQGTGTDKGRI
jgi:uncharacterized protein (TIGR02271 family)